MGRRDMLVVATMAPLR